MKTVIRVVSQAVILLFLASGPAHAWDHHYHYYSHGHYYHGPRIVVGVGVGPWWGPPYYAPWGYYPPFVAAYPPAPVYTPPVVVQPEPQPPVYVQRDDAPGAVAEEQAAPGPPQTGTYWYYCSSAGEYYPQVGTCPEQWVKVPATPE
jgi:hypothetical protein